MALFNGLRYWHAHEAWETLWRAADDEERDFYQGLILVAAGLLHLQRRNARGARNKLSEGVAKLQRYEPAHRDLVLTELIGYGSEEAGRLLGVKGVTARVLASQARAALRVELERTDE